MNARKSTFDPLSGPAYTEFKRTVQNAISDMTGHLQMAKVAFLSLSREETDEMMTRGGPVLYIFPCKLRGEVAGNAYVNMQTAENGWKYGTICIDLVKYAKEEFIVMHEVLHAVGMKHEHQRPSRDAFIKIPLMKRWNDHNVVKLDNKGSGCIETEEYDYASIMHYQLVVLKAKVKNEEVLKQCLVKNGLVSVEEQSKEKIQDNIVGTGRRLSKGDKEWLTKSFAHLPPPNEEAWYEATGRNRFSDNIVPLL